jgi:ATP-dependent RNA helicase TDRD9
MTVMYWQQVISMIESNQVTVVQGATGSGKTTQVPQYILDHYAKSGRYCNIIVTQPRRIAAISIARRVCSERKWQLGTVCGYQVNGR